jgi:mannosyl-oligosaccharide alpha-1,2-mannosidase
VLTLYVGAAGTIAEFGTMQLEFEYLSDVSGNPKYRELVLKVRDTMDKYKVRGLSLFPAGFFPVRHFWGS